MLPIGSSRPMRPSSTNCNIVIAVIGLEMLAMRNLSVVPTASNVSGTRAPIAAWWTISPSIDTATDTASEPPPSIELLSVASNAAHPVRIGASGAAEPPGGGSGAIVTRSMA